MSGKISYLVLEDKYQVKESQIKLWVNNHKHFGDEGLMRSGNKRVYSVEFKLEAITRYETSECSYRQLALELGLTNPSIIANWCRQYREESIECFIRYYNNDRSKEELGGLNSKQYRERVNYY